MSSREVAIQIFLSAVKSVHPGKLIREKVLLSDNWLSLPGAEINLDDTARIYIVGAGKATASMALAIENIIGGRIAGGHIVVKYHHSLHLDHIAITEAGHPFPDHNGFKGTGEILRIAHAASEKDLVFCLLSGGGSALLADFPEGSSEEDIQTLNRVLVTSGADIHEINVVRKHLSGIKGGQLARAVYPASLVNIMLSDVPGDAPDIIASGPAYPDPSVFGDAISVIRKFGLTEKIPVSLMSYLEKGIKGLVPETPKPGDPVFRKCYNIVAGNNRSALDGAMNEAVRHGYRCAIAGNNLCGSVDLAAGYIVNLAKKYKNDDHNPKPACLLFGGETTVKVTGDGKGGRNQHLALLCAELLKDTRGITVLAAGTDGTDGPTDAAGAVVDSDTCTGAAGKGEDASVYLADFNSYSFFRKNGGHVITGPTMTNVMDIVVVLID